MKVVELEATIILVILQQLTNLCLTHATANQSFKLIDGEIGVRMRIDQVKLVDPGELTTIFELSLFWKENSLESPLQFLSFLNGESEIVKDVFRNQKPTNFFALTDENISIWQTKVKSRTPCFLDYKDHPFDKHTCILQIETTAESNAPTLSWIDNSTENASVILKNWKAIGAQFKLLEYSIGNCKSETQVGSRNCIFVKFHFQRYYQPYITNVVIPSIMIVFLCWINFWLGENVNLRISMNLTLLLAYSVQTSEVFKSLPLTPFPKAIELWNGTTLTLILLSISETILVACLLQREAKKPNIAKVDAVDNKTKKCAERQWIWRKCSRMKIMSILDTIFKATFFPVYCLHVFLFLRKYGFSFEEDTFGV